MSLGLDALNKLQRLRSEDDAGRMPAIFPPPRRAPKPAKSPVNRWLAAGMVLSLGVAAGALWHGRGNAPVPPLPAARASAVLAANVPGAAARVAPLTIVVPPDNPPARSPGGRTTPIGSDEDLSQLRGAETADVPSFSANVTSITKQSTNAPAPASAPAAETQGPVIGGNPLVTSFIAEVKVGGVDDGSSGQRPLAMLNDSICHLNDTVNYALGIRLIDIQSARLTFEDTHGVRYVKIIFPL